MTYQSSFWTTEERFAFFDGEEFVTLISILQEAEQLAKFWPPSEDSPRFAFLFFRVYMRTYSSYNWLELAPYWETRRYYYSY